MNTENSKTNEPHRLRLASVDKLTQQADEQIVIKIWH